MGQLALMGTAEIAQRLGLSKSRTHQLVRERNFPEPAAVLTMGMVWEVAVIETWIATYRPDLVEDAEGPPPAP